MKKFLYVILLFSGASSIAMNQDTLQQELQEIMQQGYSFEDAALATFKPKTSGRIQLFWIRTAEVGYHAVPVMAVLGPALYALVQGEAVGACIISCIYPFTRFVWNANRSATMVSNEMVAKHLLPQQYARHYNKCMRLKQNMTKK